MIKGYAGLPEDFLAKNGNYYLNTRRPGLTDSTLEEITERIRYTFFPQLEILQAVYRMMVCTGNLLRAAGKETELLGNMKF